MTAAALLLLVLLHPSTALSTLSPQHRVRSPPLRSPRVRSPAVSQLEPPSYWERLAKQEDLWRFREGLLRASYTALVNWEEDGKEAAAEPSEAAEPAKSAFVASAVAVVAGSLVLRLGGRAALVSLLGLDMVADLGLEQQIDTAVEFANAFGPLAIVGFLGAWCVAKVWSLLYWSYASTTPITTISTALPHHAFCYTTANHQSTMRGQRAPALRTILPHLILPHTTAAPSTTADNKCVP